MSVIAVFLVGLFLSAFFSGCETGFYRVTRVRLMLDAMAGDTVARGLFGLSNQPSLFVATTLIGNNLANYLTALAIVLGVDRVFDHPSSAVEMLAPVVLSPVVFVYGELLPKSLYFRAPNLLLRRSGPLFLFFTVLFSPVSVLLWLLGWFLSRLVGETPLRLQMKLARKELQRVFEEGQEAGILQPAQRDLAQRLFHMAAQPVTRFCRPAARVATVRLGVNKAEVLRLARRHGVAALPVRDKNGPDLVGYVRVVDLRLSREKTVTHVLELPEVPASDSHISAMIRLQSSGAEMARVVDEQGKTVGLLYSEQIAASLFNTE